MYVCMYAFRCLRCQLLSSGLTMCSRYAFMYACIYVCMHVCMHVCMYACVYVYRYMHECKCTLSCLGSHTYYHTYIHTYIHTYTHTYTVHKHDVNRPAAHTQKQTCERVLFSCLGGSFMFLCASISHRCAS
jgi:hypothetical protein